MEDKKKKKVNIDITKHHRTFIDASGREITREEALGIKTNHPPQLRAEDGDGQEEEGTEEQGQAK